MRRFIGSGFCCSLLVLGAFGADMTVPQEAIAGATVDIQTSGTGEATAVIVGPSHIVAKKITLGQQLELSGDDVADAGRYIVILTGGGTETSKSFSVLPAKPARLGFVAHPSRAPVSQKDGITGAVYAFDAYNNLVLEPVTVDFRLSEKQGQPLDRRVVSKNGVAAVAMDSPSREGAVEFQAAAGGVLASRVVRVVADEPCTLRIHAEPQGGGVRVQTDPVKDCSGNLVPDGTLVTFTEWDAQGRSTVDASVKKGIAQANLPAKGEVRISAASGVALGNEVKLRSTP
jgi:hypothetical protein